MGKFCLRYVASRGYRSVHDAISGDVARLFGSYKYSPFEPQAHYYLSPAVQISTIALRYLKTMADIYIIGHGVFGLSTLNHVLKRFPKRRLSVISQTSDLAASDDIAKIVRVDYSNSRRMVEAAEAQKKWKGEAQFSSYYREVGRIISYETSDRLEAVNQARTELGFPVRQEHSSLMQNIFDSTTAPQHTVFNEDDAMVNWKPCIDQEREKAMEACKRSGGCYYNTGVKRLHQQAGRITRLELGNGEFIDVTTAEVVLAVGPWFAQLLQESSISLPPTWRTPVATGIFVFPLEMTQEQIENFQGKPIVTHQKGTAEFLPPTTGGATAKLTWVNPFTNKGNSSVSKVEDLSGSALAQQHMANVIEWAREYLPGLRGARISSIRSIWLVSLQAQAMATN